MKIYVFGGGGHAKVVVGTLLELGMTIEGIFDDRSEKWGDEILGIKIVGPVSEGAKISGSGSAGVIAVGDNRMRLRLAHLLKGWRWITAVHPRAWVHSSVQLGPGTIVLAGAMIQPNVRIGAHCIINTGATIDHDCTLGDFVHVAPGVNLGGNIFLGIGSFVGIGGVIIPGIHVGEWASVGAGGVVIQDVPSYTTVAGVPARIIRGAQTEAEKII
ncbi:MAG: acetyltransferase [Methanothrix sp.]|jgi:sugar O-acyltransferase (sialic acid O-acetyltransferase NeuD family)|uniref:acetyltransferase n=1 Tax=Methanothrix sp. TaxID=90426 RepID=UPI00247E81C9|nr:acetyltransferase [Methanothrix sp.]